MEYAKGNGYTLPVARYQERKPNGRYVTMPEYRNHDLKSLLEVFKANCDLVEEFLTREEQAKYALDIRIICGDVVIAEKVWKR